MPRPFNVKTPLGRKMREMGLSVNEVSAMTGINARKMSDYLAGREVIRVHHLIRLAEALECPPEELLDESNEKIMVWSKDWR